MRLLPADVLEGAFGLCLACWSFGVCLFTTCNALHCTQQDECSWHQELPGVELVPAIKMMYMACVFECNVLGAFECNVLVTSKKVYITSCLVFEVLQRVWWVLSMESMPCVLVPECWGLLQSQCACVTLVPQLALRLFSTLPCACWALIVLSQHAFAEDVGMQQMAVTAPAHCTLTARTQPACVC